MVSTVASQQEGPGFDSDWVLPVWSLRDLSVSAWVSSRGFLSLGNST